MQSSKIILEELTRQASELSPEGIDDLIRYCRSLQAIEHACGVVHDPVKGGYSDKGERGKYWAVRNPETESVDAYMERISNAIRKDIEEIEALLPYRQKKTGGSNG
jgi:predicted N-acyltransferase